MNAVNLTELDTAFADGHRRLVEPLGCFRHQMLLCRKKCDSLIDNDHQNVYADLKDYSPTPQGLPHRFQVPNSRYPGNLTVPGSVPPTLLRDRGITAK
jgi:hypothetical protein